ncbi:psbP domain-containing protein 3, chloroplastic isoform X2 [Hevea brasiliensis]|uniref:psbP domain-containing protein 3, chloroplastic isoform X2 n=1 Tax=Hevea brasiliensis TaxID=3981 RepID=UPI0025FCC588|nr:psbP domain-containing protein 3, chloroplastic isoform X2 [Hevea brasiliensis]
MVTNQNRKIMASMSLLCNWVSQRPCNRYFTPFSDESPLHVLKPNPSSLSSGIKKCRKQQLPCCSNTYRVEEQHQHQLYFSLQELPGRRELLFKIAFIGCTFPAIVYNAFAEIEWRVGTGEPDGGFKSVTAFYPEEAYSTSNVSVVITGLGPDFTRMESFGKVEAFAETLVGGLDRSWQRPPGVAAKLIDCKSSNGLYYIEYTLQNPGESRKHLYSALGMAFNGWYNRLYTVTGQFLDEEAEKYSSKIQKTVSSFRFIN